MKFVIKEGKTVQINSKLFEMVKSEYNSIHSAYISVLNGTKSNNPWVSKINNAGGSKMLAELRDEHSPFVFWLNKPLKDVLIYEADPIIQRRMTKEQFEQKLSSMKESTISLAFWMDNPAHDKDKEVPNASAGLYMPKYGALNNFIALKFQWGKAAGLPGISQHMATTIRHELQHFTQMFYGKLFGLYHDIGLPTKKIFKGKPHRTSETGKHEDIPVEVATDIQDEIDYYLPELRDYRNNPKSLKQAILNIVGIGYNGYESPVFKHYFATNKEIWKWGVSKLLSSVKAL
jgi:hypothetical protein